jgi:hypothetical protein
MKWRVRIRTREGKSFGASFLSHNDEEAVPESEERKKKPIKNWL